MDLKTVIKEIFLSEYPEYDNTQTKITVNINGRFDKNGGDIVLEMPHPKHPEYNTYVYYWFLMVDTESDEYKAALDRWLRHLQGQYMSAVWGQEIEKLVASKASNNAIKSLEEEIQRVTALIGSLSGGSNGINLKDLNDQILENKTNIESVIGEEGSLPKLQEEVKITPEKLGRAIQQMGVAPLSVTRDNPQGMTLEAYNTMTDTARREW
jgi:spore germination protein GerM